MVSSGISFIKFNKNAPGGSRSEAYRWINRQMCDLPYAFIHSMYMSWSLTLLI